METLFMPRGVFKQKYIKLFSAEGIVTKVECISGHPGGILSFEIDSLPKIILILKPLVRLDMGENVKVWSRYGFGEHKEYLNLYGFHSDWKCFPSDDGNKKYLEVDGIQVFSPSGSKIIFQIRRCSYLVFK